MSLLTPVEPDAASRWLVDELASAVFNAPARQGQTAFVERTAPAGAMAPLHARDEAETYRVLEGEVTYYIGGDVVHAVQGDVVVAAAGVRRTFRAESDARWLVLTRVASLEAFLDFNRAVAKPCGREWPSPEELAALSSVAAANGIELIGPPGVLPGDRDR